MDDTAESAGDSAAELEGFAERFKGAMGIAVSALAVAGAGLLSQLPIIGEVTSGISAIIDSLILKIDSDLRPALSGFRDDLFGVAQDVRNAEGSLEGLGIAIQGVRNAITEAQVTAFQSKIESLTGITIPENWLEFGWDLITLQASQTFSNIGQIIRNFPDDVSTLLTSINKDVGRTFDSLRSSIASSVDSLVSDFESGITGIPKAFTDLAGDITTWASNLASDAKSWGKDLINGFIAGIKAVIGKVQQWLSTLRDIGGDIGIDVPSLGGLGGGGGGDGGGGGGIGGAIGGAIGAVTGGTQIDGRQLTESTGRYRKNQFTIRGI